MLETPFQKKVTAALKKAGWEIIRLRATDRAGWPDLLALKGLGKMLWLEVKRPDGKGKVSELQKRKMRWLRENGFEVRVVENLEQLKTIL